MALLQSLQLDHLPASYILHVALFHSVNNAAFLQQQLLDGNAEFEYALIDASVVRAAIYMFLRFMSREDSGTPFIQ